MRFQVLLHNWPCLLSVIVSHAYFTCVLCSPLIITIPYVNLVWDHRSIQHRENWKKWLLISRRHFSDMKIIGLWVQLTMSSLVQVMAWCRIGNKPLLEPMMPSNDENFIKFEECEQSSTIWSLLFYIINMIEHFWMVKCIIIKVLEILVCWVITDNKYCCCM